VVQLAQERSNEMTERDAIVQTARNSAKNIIEEARQEAGTIRADADAYVLQVLQALEDQLVRNLTVARNGITKLIEDRESGQVSPETFHQEVAAEIEAVTQELAEAADEVTVDAEGGASGQDQFGTG
jgi:cell division septum initiation protein DivIVA